MRTKHRIALAASLLAAALSTPAAARDRDATPPASEPAPWQLEWDTRLRQEQVDTDAFSRDAEATTLRLRVGLRAVFGDGWSALLEGVGVASAGERYNSGANGRTQYPAITDPQGKELNQAWLQWQAGTFGTTLGRQRILLDNQRWVGNSGWRQLEQSFDAVALQWHPTVDWTVRYDWLGRVHRVAGPDALNPVARRRQLDTHLLNTSYVHGAQNWIGYAYLHEDEDVRTSSTATYGLRWTGDFVEDGTGVQLTLEFARQSDYANNPASFATRYWLVEPTWTAPGWGTTLGWEHLGGDGRQAVQTPLATLHAFNGWNDQFNVIPTNGLEDRYLGFNGRLGRGSFARKLSWALVYHDYRADRGGRYGSEWNASLALGLGHGLTGMLKAASYRADGFGSDNAKLWLQLEWKGKQPVSTLR